MKQLKEIINKLEKKYSDIDYYYSIIELIEKNLELNPDISIEGCKSLLEGLSKFIIKQIDSNSDSKQIDKMDFHGVFKLSIAKISNYCDFFEEDFVTRACSIIHLLGEIRNKRGDISHGKLSPKAYNSNVLFSTLVVQITDSLASYILICFSNLEFEKDLVYSDNELLNEWLDEQYPELTISYSKGLFEQDIEAYKQELFDFQDLKENS